MGRCAALWGRRGFPRFAIGAQPQHSHSAAQRSAAQPQPQRSRSAAAAQRSTAQRSTAHGLPAAHELLREEVERLADPVVDNVLDLPTQQSLLVLLQVRFLKTNRQNLNDVRQQLSERLCFQHRCALAAAWRQCCLVQQATMPIPVIRCGSEAATHAMQQQRPIYR